MDVDVQEKNEAELKRRGRPRKDRNALKRHLPETQQKLHNHPDPTISRTVATMALAGFPQAEICKALKMSTDTLSQYYHDEFTHGKTKVMTEVVGSLAQRAIAGSDTAAIWLTKTRLGWTDRQQVDMNANVELTVQRGTLVSELAGLIQKGITIDATPEPENPGQTETSP